VRNPIAEMFGMTDDEWEAERREILQIQELIEETERIQKLADEYEEILEPKLRTVTTT
jgi:hypothetical protein